MNNLHHAPGYGDLPCLLAEAGACFVCSRIDPASPRFDPDIRCLFVPAECPGWTPPEPPAVVPAAGSPPPPSVPLAGDLVEAVTKKVGLKRLTKWLHDALGVECGCAARARKLNALDARLRKRFGLGSPA